MKTKDVIKLFGILLVVAALISCASAPSTSQASQKAGEPAAGAPSPEPTDSPMYYGTGSGSSQTAAMNRAKLNAVRKAVQDAVGAPTALAKQDQIESLFSEDTNANTFVYNESTEILDRSSENGSSTVTLGVRNTLEAVANVLRGNDIYGNKVLPQGGEVTLLDQKPPAAFAKAEPEQKAAEGEQAAAAQPQAEEQPESAAAEKEIDPEQAQIINDIVDNLVYMVYYNEETEDDPFLAKTAVGMANKYLSQQSLDYVDMEQVERIKEDQMAAYEAETGKGVTVLQWIAGKLNADIYIEVSVDAQTETKKSRYYGSASVSLKNFDASTGAGRATAFYQTVPPAMSTVSVDDAVNNAVASATYKAMQEALKQAQNYTEKELRQGIKYQLVLQNTPDARAVRDFVKRMERQVEEIKRMSYSPEEAKYEIRLIGKITDLEDIVYDVSESVDGMQGMYLVYQRGNSITFDTGM